MKTITSKKKASLLLLLMCLISSVGFANPEVIFNDFNNKYKYSKKKTIDANYEAYSDYTIDINGRYSDYKISSWDQSYIAFHVEVVTKSDVEKKAEELLNKIRIEFDESRANKRIGVETVISNNNFRNVGFHIVYYIMLPKDVYINIDNIYGDVQMDKATRKINAEIKYGDISIDSVFSESSFDMKYGNVKLRYVERSYIDIAYGDVEIDNAVNLNIDMAYGDADLGVTRGLQADLAYSDLSCVCLDKDFEEINVSASYSDIKLNMAKTQGFSYEISTMYGDIESKKLKDNATRLIKENYRERIVGNFNDKDNNHRIILDGMYSDIEVFDN